MYVQSDLAMQSLLLYIKFSDENQTSPGFYCLQYKSFENTVRKGEIARNDRFLLFPQCFLPFLEKFPLF